MTQHPIRMFRDVNKETLMLAEVFCTDTNNVWWVISQIKYKQSLIKWLSTKWEDDNEYRINT